MAPNATLVTLLFFFNLTGSIVFYTRRLGARLNDRGRGKMKDFWASIRLAGSEMWLIAPEKREPRKLAYTLIAVRNIKSYVGRLQKSGITFQRPERMSKDTKIVGPIAFDAYGASAFFKDSEGNLLMIWQDTNA